MEELSAENESQCLQNEISSDGLDSKVKEVMETIKRLEVEKQQAQEEFGVQRARLKELYMKKEEELMRESQERVRLQELTDRLQHELNETKSQLLLASFRLESDIAQEKRKRQEEVASLEKLMQEAVEEASLSQKRFKDEIRRLQKMNERLDSELNDAHRPAGDQGPRLPLGGAAVAALAPITAYTKSFARKVGSLGPGLSSSNSNAAQVTSPSTASSTGILSSTIHPNVGESCAVVSSLTSSEENLEEGMRKAQEDAEVLRSLVIPLEEEIEALKDKLRNAYHILKSYGYEDGKDNSVKESEEVQPAKKSEQPDADNIANDGEAYPREDGSATHGQLPNGSPTTNISQDFQRLNTNAAGEETLCRSSSHTEGISGSEHSNECPSLDDKHQQLQPFPISNVCHMCANYEAQLQKMQEEVRDLEKKRKVAERASERYRDELVKETEFRKDMEEKWNEKKEQHKNQVLELKAQMEASEKLVQDLRTTFNKVNREARFSLEKLVNEREEVSRELIRLQNENDKLVGKHSAHSQELQNETINLPDKVEELQELLLKFREEVIAAKVGKEAAEETERTLQEECLNLYEQIRNEQQKNSEFQVIVQKQKQDLVHLQSVEGGLQQQLAETSKKLEEVLIVKKESDAALSEFRNRVSGLHKELDVSVKVQQDLVQLSQSLQVQLEHIRESEKEVRWQHEDDVEECAGCRNHFSPAISKKHCNHCGRIFCPTCLSQTVTSGPNHRQYNVCKVCHTLLVREKPLFFSSETTDLPD